MTCVVEHVETVASQPFDVEHLKQVEKHAVDLAKQFPDRFASLSKAKIILFRDAFNKSIAQNKKHSQPIFSELSFYRLLIQVYSTSDLKHPVITPAMLLMCQYLSQGAFYHVMDVFSGLYLCELLYEVI